MEANSDNRPVSDDSGIGYLVVHVTTARGAIPLEGALVTVRKYDQSVEDTAESGDVLVTLISGRDGNTARYPLPAPPRAESQAPTDTGKEKPYATYALEVRLEGYRDQTYVGIPIFDGITAIQPADMIPLPEDGRNDSRAPENEQFFGNAEPEL